MMCTQRYFQTIFDNETIYIILHLLNYENRFVPQISRIVDSEEEICSFEHRGSPRTSSTINSVEVLFARCDKETLMKINKLKLFIYFGTGVITTA